MRQSEWRTVSKYTIRIILEHITISNYTKLEQSHFSKELKIVRVSTLKSRRTNVGPKRWLTSRSGWAKGVGPTSNQPLAITLGL